MTAKFHWRLLQGGETAGDTRAAGVRLARTGLPDLARQIDFCKQAERAGITGLLTAFGSHMPDPILLASAAGLATERIEFIIAFRSGLISPTYFVQQLNTLSNLIDGRFSLNIVAGHSPREQRFYGDFLPHDERYLRTEEFLAVCRALWNGAEGFAFDGRFYRTEPGKLKTPFVSRGRAFPEIFIGGGSDPARDLAIRQGTCWLLMADAPERLGPRIRPVLAAGKEVGLRLSIISRPTREEAVRAACGLIGDLDPATGDRRQEETFVNYSDSVSMRDAYELAGREQWLTPTLWTGAVRSHGPAAVALVGSPREVAAAIVEYLELGISQFIFSGWPKLDEMTFFGAEILPLVRSWEAGRDG